MTIKLNEILKSTDLPQSVEFDKKNNLFLFSNWNTHNVFIDKVLKIEGGKVQIKYVSVDENGDPEGIEDLTSNSELTTHQANSLQLLLKESFKIKPKINAYIDSNLDEMLSGFDEDVVAIRNNLNSHIALEIITLLSEDYNGFSKVTYDFSTSWYFNSGGGLEVLMLLHQNLATLVLLSKALAALRKLCTIKLERILFK